MVRLIVAEKPSVARDLARVLNLKKRGDQVLMGQDTWVTWCVGHMAELCEPEAYDPALKRWSAETLPIVPEIFRLRPTRSAPEVWERLSALVRDPAVTTLINACDAGREGELIFRYVLDLTDVQKPTARLWLQAMTDLAITRAMADLRPHVQYNNLGDAARCRAEADWLIGMNATRALTLRARHKGKSGELYTVGRVQTPTLAMVIARERAIESFVAEPFWQVRAHFKHAAGSFWGTYTREGKDRILLAEGGGAHAALVAQAVENQEGVISRVLREEKPLAPPPLFDLTSLQRLANRRHALSAQQTLEAAQALYEQHKAITYPRTDSAFLPADVGQGLPTIFSRLSKTPIAPCLSALEGEKVRLGRHVIDAEKVTDHHAIIPTGRAQARGLSLAERQIYELIVRRTVAAVLAPALYATCRLETQVQEHLFVALGRTLLRPGWLAAEPSGAEASRERSTPQEKASEVVATLPLAHQGDKVMTEKTRAPKSETRPPPRLTEATLLGAMQRAGTALSDFDARKVLRGCGIGTPATRASIIETLKRRGYVTLEGRHLQPTPQGKILIDSLPFSTLSSPQLTADWELKLGQVAEGRFSRAAFMSEVRDLTREVVRLLMAGMPPAAPRAWGDGAAAQGLRRESTLRSRRSDRASAREASSATKTLWPPCPVCGRALLLRERLVACEGGRECSLVIFRSVAGYKLSDEDVLLLLKKKKTPKREGFVARDGRIFAAVLALDAQGRVSFAKNAAAKKTTEKDKPKRRKASASTKKKADRDTARTIV